MELLATKDLVFLNKIRYPDIVVEKGNHLFIVGESGSGKSSLLRLFNGVLSPSSGQIRYQGEDIQSSSAVELRRKILLVSQQVFLFEKSIAENFAAFYEYRDLTPPQASEMQKALQVCNIDFPLETDVTTMSGGERQRVYIAIFLSFRPDVLMLDEPTSALDAEHADSVMQGILEYCSLHQITLVAVSHDRRLVEQYASSIVELKGGQS